MTVATVATRQALSAWAVGSTPTSQNSLILDIFLDRAKSMSYWPYTWPRHTYTRVASLLGVFHCRRTFRLGRHIEATGGTPCSGRADVRIKFKEYLIGVRSFWIMSLHTYNTRLATGRSLPRKWSYQKLSDQKDSSPRSDTGGHTSHAVRA